jgi:hypothetical protein
MHWRWLESRSVGNSFQASKAIEIWRREAEILTSRINELVKKCRFLSGAIDIMERLANNSGMPHELTWMGSFSVGER